MIFALGRNSGGLIWVTPGRGRSGSAVKNGNTVQYQRGAGGSMTLRGMLEGITSKPFHSLMCLPA
jgi:hypothetical protein